MNTSAQPCRRHQIVMCLACTKTGYSNVTMAAPREFKPHIAFALGYWRVSSLSYVLRSRKMTREQKDVVLKRWEDAQRLITAWNAYSDDRARMLAPQHWKPVPGHRSL